MPLPYDEVEGIGKSKKVISNLRTVPKSHVYNDDCSAKDIKIIRSNFMMSGNGSIRWSDVSCIVRSQLTEAFFGPANSATSLTPATKEKWGSLQQHPCNSGCPLGPVLAGRRDSHKKTLERLSTQIPSSTPTVRRRRHHLPSYSNHFPVTASKYSQNGPGS